MFYSAVRVKGYISVLVSGFSKSRNLKFSFFQTGELLNFRKPQSSTKILSIIGDSDFQFSSHRAILIYFRKNHRKMKHASDSIENNVKFVNNYIYFF